jgi:hypothetical protein
VRVLIWNFGVTDGVHLSFGQLAGGDRPTVSAHHNLVDVGRDGRIACVVTHECGSYLQDAADHVGIESLVLFKGHASLKPVSINGYCFDGKFSAP